MRITDHRRGYYQERHDDGGGDVDSIEFSFSLLLLLCPLSLNHRNDQRLVDFAEIH